MAVGVLVTAVMLGNVQGAAGQAAGAAARPDTPLVTYRKAVMEGLVAQVRALRALLGANIGHEGDMRRHSEALLANALMVSALFPESSKGESSSALGEIWARPDDFKARVQNLQDAARALDAAAQDGDRGLAGSHLQILIGTCGGCHSNFKLPAPLPSELMSPL